MNLVRDMYEIAKILKKYKIVPTEGLREFRDLLKIIVNVVECMQKNRNVVIDTVKNSCDFFIPLTALGHVKLSPSTIGWLGVISSLAGLIVLVEPLTKLSPA